MRGADRTPNAFKAMIEKDADRIFGPKNVKYKVFTAGRRRQLIITIDLNKHVGISKSGKSFLIATTGGNVQIPELIDTKLSVNVFKPRTQRKKTKRR